MNNVIVKQSTISSAWHVTLPEYPSNQIWSAHDDQASAEREAHEVAADMGYDGVTVETSAHPLPQMRGGRHQANFR